MNATPAATTARKLVAFLRRDFLLATSYRFALALQFVQILLFSAMAFFLARFLRQQGLVEVTPFARDYFSFVILGVAFFDYLGTALNTFSQALREGQLTATLESLLVTQTRLETVVLGSALYAFLATTVRVGVFLLVGTALFGLPLGEANWAAAFTLLLLSVAAFSALGILSACFILLFKRGNPFAWALLSASGLLGGVFYPVQALPDWMQTLARLLPLTYCLEGIRRALLAGAGLAELWPQTVALLLFAGLGLPAALLLFRVAVRRAKVTGTLAHY
ncbi:MAG: ABC transporter permease [Terriglobia bacterium]